MPDISAKGKAMPDSPIRKLAPFANAAKERGTQVIHLNIGQPDIATPEVAMDAMRNVDRTVLEYSPSEGFARYRERLARYYNGVGVDVTADEILVTTGGSEALVFAFMSCLDAGDEVIIPEPFYANYNGFATLAGIKIVPVTARIEDGFSLPPMAEFERAITDRTKAILICNPGNPTGTKYPDSALEALAALVQEKDLFLFADEVYREFTYDGSNARSILTVPRLEEHAVVIDSVSKRYSMCGARIGALVTRNQAVRRTAMKFAMARLSPPTLAQIAAEAALDTPDSYFDEVRTLYRDRRDALVDGLAAIDGVTCPKPGGAFYAVAKLPIDDADVFCQWMLESFEHEGATVMMAPNTGFYATRGLGKQEVRMAYVLKREEIEKAVACLRAALSAYPGTVK